jgi:hypothetical protein
MIVEWILIRKVKQGSNDLISEIDIEACDLHENLKEDITFGRESRVN